MVLDLTSGLSKVSSQQRLGRLQQNSSNMQNYNINGRQNKILSSKHTTLKNMNRTQVDPTLLQNQQIDKIYQSGKDNQNCQNTNLSKTRPQTVTLVRQSKELKNEKQQIQSSQIKVPSPVEQYEIKLTQQNSQKQEFKFQIKNNNFDLKNKNQINQNIADQKQRYPVNKQQQYGLINNSFVGMNTHLVHKGVELIHENKFKVSRNNQKQQEQEIQVSAEMGIYSFTLEGDSVPLQNTQEKQQSQDFQNTNQSFVIGLNSKNNEERIQVDLPSILALSNRIDKAIQESFIEEEAYGSPQGQKQIKGINLKQRYQDQVNFTQAISLANSLQPITDTLQNFSKIFTENQGSKIYTKKLNKTTDRIKRPQSQMRGLYNNSIRNNPTQNQFQNKTIDLEFLKFYEAFKNQENSSKPPIKPSGVTFKDDIDKLKKVTNEIKQTMNKLDQQHMERDALSKLFKKELESTVLPLEQVKNDSDVQKFVSMTEILTQKINTPKNQQTQLMNHDSSEEILQISNMIPQQNSLIQQHKNTFDQRQLTDKTEIPDLQNQFYSEKKLKVVQKDTNLSHTQINVVSETSVKTEEFLKKTIFENQLSKIENEQTQENTQQLEDQNKKILSRVSSIITGSQLPKSESLSRIASASYKRGNWQGVPMRKTSTKSSYARNSKSVHHERTQYYRQPKISQLDFDSNIKIISANQTPDKNKFETEITTKKHEESKSVENNQISFMLSKQVSIERPLLDTKNAYNNAINFILSAKDYHTNSQSSNEIIQSFELNNSKQIAAKTHQISVEKLQESPVKNINEVVINKQKEILRALDMELQQKLQTELVASDNQFINFKSEPVKQIMRNVISNKIEAISGKQTNSIGKQFFTRLKNQKNSLGMLEQIQQRKFEDNFRENILASNQMVKLQVFVKQNTFQRKKTLQPYQTYNTNWNVFGGLNNSSISKKELNQKKKMQHEILCHIQVPQNRNNFKDTMQQTNQSNISPKSKGVISNDISPFFIQEHHSNNQEKSQAITDQISGLSRIPSAMSQINKNKKQERNQILQQHNSLQNKTSKQVQSVVIPNPDQNVKEGEVSKQSEAEKKLGFSVKSLNSLQIEKLNNIVLKQNTLKNRFSQKSMKIRNASQLEGAHLYAHQLEKPESQQILKQIQKNNFRNEDQDTQEFLEDLTVKKIKGQNSSTQLIDNLIYEQKTEISRQKVYSSQFKKDQQPKLESQQQQSFHNLNQAESQISLLAPVLQQDQNTESKNSKSIKQIFLQSFENDQQPFAVNQVEPSIKSPLSEIIKSTISNTHYPLVSITQNYLMGIGSPSNEYETEPIPEVVENKYLVTKKKRQDSFNIKQNLKISQNEKNKLCQESGMKVQNMNFDYQIQKNCFQMICESNEHKILSEVPTSAPKGNLLQKISNLILLKNRKSEDESHRPSLTSAPKQPSDSERRRLHSRMSQADRPGQLKRLFVCPRQPNLKDFTLQENKEQKIRSKTTKIRKQDSEFDAYQNWIIYNKVLKQETYNGNKIVYFPENHNNLNRNIAFREREEEEKKTRQHRLRYDKLLDQQFIQD